MKIDCPHCGVHGTVDDSFAGKKLRCPKCSKVFLPTYETLPGTDDGGLVHQEILADSPSETEEQVLAETGAMQESVEAAETGDEAVTDDAIDQETCSVCGQSFASDFLVEIDSQLYCALCKPESADEDAGETSGDDLLEDVEEEGVELETADLFAEEDDLLESDGDREDDSGEEDEAALEAEVSEVEDDESVTVDALMSDVDELEDDDYPRETCSVCGESFHRDFLQEVDSKFYCGLCQPEVIEEITDEESETVPAAESEELAVAGSEEREGEELVTDTDEEEWAQPGDSGFTVGELIKEAWQMTKGAKASLWGGLIVMYGILVALSFGGVFAMPKLAAQTDPNTAMGISAGVQLVTAWLSMLFTAGLMLIGVRRVFGEEVSWKMVFAGFSKGFTITIAMILQTILVGIGFLLLVLPGIYLSIGYALTLPLILDKGLGPWEAMEASRKAIHKKWWTVLGVYLVMMLLYAISAIPLGLGLIWTIPMFFVLIGVLYARLFGDGFDAGAESDDEEENENSAEEGEEELEEVSEESR